jgi:hypothetical protein
MDYSSCPTGIINAPVELVWTLLMRPERWGEFYDVSIASANPAGLASVGQTVFAESGPHFLHLKLQFRFVEIDAPNYKLGLDVRLPLGVTVRETRSAWARYFASPDNTPISLAARRAVYERLPIVRATPSRTSLAALSG